MKKTSVSLGFCGAVVTGLLTLSATPAVAQDASSGTAAPVTFAKDVAPILYEHCTTCHRPGEIAPMSLITYEDARPWARAIKDNVVKGTMPPWHADPAHGTWSNDRRLSAAEKELIVRWVDAGAPSGDLKAMPPKPAFTEGWVIGAPDAVVRMTAPYDIPATGEIPYQYFEVPDQLCGRQVGAGLRDSARRSERRSSRAGLRAAPTAGRASRTRVPASESAGAVVADHGA